MPLNLKPNFQDADGFYDSLVQAHDDLDPAQSEALNARIILMLANHIGDTETLALALQLAREDVLK
ncbi:hypothetical protein C1J03_01035 [Sulfitobacter sp. SK012]|uniref:DUF2783 domain-containing protein n=1 Tax=Sulfitobacter sp. SK012 TaxID=1389005 RepID=UPI000E0C9BA7|nr:DUF2783 domain-containing protein [Sulfitobacter sp. SK012]AXI44737.1 hypothetical protein C1J03_01035 [Sulfitobacter sp. SK012]